MQLGVALRVMVACVVGLVAAGCAQTYVNAAYTADVDRVMAAHADSSRQIAAPTTLEPRPWKVGAWALYKRGGTYAPYEGYEKISVAAVDSCGTWIAIESQGYYDRHRWLICFRLNPDGTMHTTPDPVDRVQLAIWESNGGPPHFVGVRDQKEREDLKPVVERLLPPPGLDNTSLPREDVDVPAGHFAQTIRTTENLAPSGSPAVTRWSHPDVPFDGAVKRRTSDGREHLLLAYGDDGASVVIPDLASALAAAMLPQPTPGNYFRFGLGYSWFSGHSSERSSQAEELSIISGVRLATKVDLIGEVGVVSGADSPDPMFSQSTLSILLGARWAPFRLPHLQPRSLPHGASALYVQADLGYSELWRDSMNGNSTVARGGVVGAAVGWLGIQARDWAWGVEVTDHLHFFKSGAGIRNNLGIIVLWQLYLPRAR